MSKQNSRYVVRHPDGWAVRKPRGERPSNVFSRQRDAIDWARKIVSNQGGGEVRIQNQQGRWRDSDTVAPGNDPFPPRDTK